MGLHFTTVHLILRFRKSDLIIVYTLEEEDEEEEEEYFRLARRKQTLSKTHKKEFLFFTRKYSYFRSAVILISMLFLNFRHIFGGLTYIVIAVLIVVFHRCFCCFCCYFSGLKCKITFNNTVLATDRDIKGLGIDFLQQKLASSLLF